MPDAAERTWQVYLATRAEPAYGLWWLVALNVAVFAIFALSFEANDYFAREIAVADSEGSEWREMQLARQLSLSVIWALYGGGMLAVGFWRGNRLLRVMALGLLALTIVKVFLVDLSSLDRVYRIVSFIVLGAILLLVSFLYQRSQQRAAEGGP